MISRIGWGMLALFLAMVVGPVEASAQREPRACIRAKKLKTQNKPAALAKAERACKKALARQAKAKKQANRRAKAKQARRKANAQRRAAAARATRARQAAASKPTQPAARPQPVARPRPAARPRAANQTATSTGNPAGPGNYEQLLNDNPERGWEVGLPRALEVEEAGCDFNLDKSPASFPKRWAAREVMVLYIEVMSGLTRKQLLGPAPASDSLHARLGEKVREYLEPKSPVADRSPTTLANAARLAGDPAFHKRVIGKLAAAKHHATYFGSERYQSVITEGELSSPAGQQTKLALQKEKDPKVDRNVFGISLGDPMRLPRCPRGKALSADAVCYWPDGWAKLAHAFLSTGMWDSTPGTRQVSISLGSRRCPDWVSGCGAMLVLKDGYIVGAQFRADDRWEDSYVQGRLSAKYGEPKVTRLDPLNCSSSYTSFGKEVVKYRQVERKLRAWKKPGLLVAYRQACSGGAVEIRTGVYQRLLERLEASSPKL